MANYGRQFARGHRSRSNWSGAGPGYGGGIWEGSRTAGSGRMHEDYDTDYGYRGGIGLGSRWANRSGEGWSGGARRGGFASDDYFGRHPARGMGYGGSMGGERSFGTERDARFGRWGAEHTGFDRDWQRPSRGQWDLEPTFRGNAFGYGSDFDRDYDDDFGDRLRRGWNRFKSRARDFFEADEGYGRDFAHRYDRDW